ncbi:MAG: hydantoinase/oxoprolinase family protein, partial [Proteobacteria bacterium]|nr:hydantoinase/oxoprolinase family protein [Pseudomonadota bacterium]
RIVVSVAADMRYVGQEHAVTVDLAMRLFVKKDFAAIKRAFDRVHARRYGTSAPEEKAQIVSLRTSVAGLLKKPPIDRIESGGEKPARGAQTGQRKVYMGGDRPVDTRLYSRDALRAGNIVRGPALIEEDSSTVVLRPKDRMVVDEYGNLVISVGGMS